MKKILLLIILTLWLYSCEKHTISHGRKIYKEYLQKTLIDPNSLIIYSEKFEEHNEKFGETGYREVTWTVDIGAKNSLGGMVRITYIFETSDNLPLIYVKRDYEDLGLINVENL